MVTTLAPIANRLITQQLAFRDASALAPFEAGRFYPIRAKQSTQVVPSEYVPHPSTISPDAVRTFDAATIHPRVRQYAHWIGKFGPHGSIVIRLNRQPVAAVANLLRGDQSGHVGRWGMDRVVEPANHAEVEWLYGVPGIAPGSHELFDPDIVDEMYRAIRTLGVTSVSYEPLRESVSSFATVGGVRVPNKDEHRIALFSRILTVMHRRVAEETGTVPLIPLDDFPRRRPRIGVEVQREIRRPKADGFVPTTLRPSLDVGPSERWEAIRTDPLRDVDRPEVIAWRDVQAWGPLATNG